mmetsp:Transcript_7925/g.14928  ORF Transcript_7925/g.14928 Transcript_7925/m.14928 type:complete len:288 (-) Transcript_7925:46-909(-)
MLGSLTVAGLLFAMGSSAQELMRKERDVSHHGHLELEGNDVSDDTELEGSHRRRRRRRRRTALGTSVDCSDFHGMTNTGDVSITSTGLGPSGGPDNSTGCGSKTLYGQATCEAAYEINNGAKFKCVWKGNSSDVQKCKGYRARGTQWACHCPDVERPSSQSCYKIANVYGTQRVGSCRAKDSQTDCNNKYYEYHGVGLNVKCAWDNGKCGGWKSNQAIVSCCYAGASGVYEGHVATSTSTPSTGEEEEAAEEEEEEEEEDTLRMAGANPQWIRAHPATGRRGYSSAT